METGHRNIIVSKWDISNVYIDREIQRVNQLKLSKWRYIGGVFTSIISTLFHLSLQERHTSVGWEILKRVTLN